MNPFTIEGEVIPNFLMKKIIESGYLNTYKYFIETPLTGLFSQDMLT